MTSLSFSPRISSSLRSRSLSCSLFLSPPPPPTLSCSRSLSLSPPLSLSRVSASGGHIRNKSWLRYTRLEGGKQIGLIPRAPGSLNTSFPNGGNSGDNVAFDFIEPHGRTTTSFLRASNSLFAISRSAALLRRFSLSPFDSPRKPRFILRAAANIHIIK